VSRAAAVLASLLALSCAGFAAELLGAISGAVLNASTGTPLAGSTVVLCQADGSPIRTVMADRRGRYVFEQVPAGYYQVKASRPNFAGGRYGQKSWDQAGQVISLAAGAAFTADIHLHRWGVITGTVIDENGEGIPGFTVNAITANPNVLTGRVSSAGITDDRGVFRITGLRPGRYYVATAPRQMPDGAGLLPTYYPGSLNLAESRAVTVDIDGETGNVQIQPIAGNLVRLSGIVAGAAAHGRSHVNVTLFRDVESREMTAGPDGQFVFADLVPGRYTLVALLPDEHQQLAAYQPLELYGDRDGLAVNLSPAPELRVRLVDGHGAGYSDPQIMIFLSRVENGARTQPVRAEPTQTPGSYLAGGLMPGQWRLFVICPPSSVVESVTVDGQDALGGFLLMPGKRATATVRISRQAATVRGRVASSSAPAAGVSVICYPLDGENRNRLGGFRSQKTNWQGQYQVTGLPEGEYLLFATAVEEFNPDDHLDELKTRVPPLHVPRSADLTQDLSVLD
jgi:hypothetical protein